MPLTRRSRARWCTLGAIGAAVLFSRPLPAFAFLDSIGHKSVEELSPILANALAEAGTQLTKAEDHLGDIGGQLLSSTDQILSRQLLQVKVEGTELGDHLLSGVDTLAKNRLDQVDVIASKLVTQADSDLKVDIRQLGQEVDGAVAKANHALADRISQLDETASRQLGNVDVIASKQRIALEETAIHIGVLLGLVIFVVFVFWRLWSKYLELTADEKARARANADAAGGIDPGSWTMRGSSRAWMLTKGLGPGLLRDLALAGAAVGVLLGLYQLLPYGARKQETALADAHEQALVEALRLFDATQVRFHASQLQYLRPEKTAHYQGLVAKGDLLRDLIARPTLLGTDPGLTELAGRLADTRRLLGSDPDLVVVEALLVWQTGASRREEQRAASLCARAIRLGQGSRGFVLAAFARAYVESFLAAPYLDAAAGLGPDAETPEDLSALLDAVAPDREASPLSATLAVARLMRRVDAASSSAYAAMVEAHARFVHLSGAHGSAAEVAAARATRTAAASAVIDAWTAFDRALLAAPELARSPAVLAVFRLDDASYTRAKWFVDRTDERLVAPLLTSPGAAGPAAGCAAPLPAKNRAGLRLELAPPRVVWAQRYRALYAGPARAFFELQEANRFATRERLTQKLECDMVEGEASPARRLDAAIDAASLGLYVGGATGSDVRKPFARIIVPAGSNSQMDPALALRGVRLL